MGRVTTTPMGNISYKTFSKYIFDIYLSWVRGHPIPGNKLFINFFLRV